MNSQATLLRNTPQEMTKEFLNENQMRRAKVQANCNHMEQNCLKIASTQVAHEAIVKVVPEKPAIQRSTQLNPLLLGQKQQQSPIMVDPPESNLDLIHSQDEEMEKTMVMETPMPLEPNTNLEPPDPGETEFSRTELDVIMAHGTDEVIAWGNTEVPMREHENMAIGPA
ncbi:hypothetical protein S245_008177 [Arachis hypogaea]